MKIEGWRNYQHVAIPNIAPHEPVNIAQYKMAPFDTAFLKSKRRYEINKDSKRKGCRRLCGRSFLISMAAYFTYPVSYKPDIDHDSFVEYTSKCEDYKQYGAFSWEDGSLYGYV